VIDLEEFKGVIAQTLAEVLASKDESAPLTASDLMRRWEIPGADESARLHNLARRCRDWGLVPMKGTRGREALYGRVAVQAAEAYAAGRVRRRRAA
jgi:hypothetical protein